MSKTVIGYDAGTAHQIAASDAGVDIQKNCFLTIDKKATTKKQLKKLNVPYVELNKELHLIGQDASNYSAIFPNSTLKRPMANGLLNPAQTDALPVLRHIVGTLIGGEASPGSIVAYSVPANPIDENREVDYHRDVLKEIIEFYGYKAIPVNEAHALGLASLKDDRYTGISCSLGAGMSNLAVSYLGMSSLTFSVTKGGDWLDEMVAKELNINPAKAQKIKESGDYSIDPNSSERLSREHNAIKSYYESLIRYVLANIANQFENSEDTPVFPEPVPFVLGGGGAMPNGFLELFKEQFTQQDFPVEISEIRLAEEPLINIAQGCLEHAKMEIEEDEEEQI